MVAFLFVLFAFLMLDAAASLLLLPAYKLSFAFVTLALLALYLLVFVRLSIHRDLAQRRGIRLAAFFLGTFTKTYVTETDLKELQERYTHAKRLKDLEGYAAQGLIWIGLPDLVYLQWPFYSVVPVTTAQLRVVIAESDGIWTTEQELFCVVRTTRKATRDKDGKVTHSEESVEETEWQTLTPTTRKPPAKREKTVVLVDPADLAKGTVETSIEERVETQAIPRIQLRMNGEVFIRLGINIGPLLLTFPDAPLGVPTGEAGLESYLSGKIQPFIHEAVRDAVAGYTRRQNGTVVPGLTWEGLLDVVKMRREIKARVCDILGSQPESILIQSGLLREWEGDPKTPDAGQSASAFDLVIESVVPKNEVLQKAIDAVAVARKQAQAAVFEGTATRSRERGLTDALKERREELGVDGETVLAHDFGRNTKADLTLIAPDLASALAMLLKKRRGK